MEYITGYMKTKGHVVLEKAAVKGINCAMAVCGDLEDLASGKNKGALASFFQNEFLSGISKNGEDYLSAAAFSFSTAPVNSSPIIGPGSEFGSGCAGILAAGRSAYAYVTEGSGMCIVRYADVFGKRKLIRCISSDEGGEDVFELTDGSMLIACPEKWTDEYMTEYVQNEAAGSDQAQLLSDHMMIFDPGDIRSDDAFDRRLNELGSAGFDGCIAAILVKTDL